GRFGGRRCGPCGRICGTRGDARGLRYRRRSGRAGPARVAAGAQAHARGSDGAWGARKVVTRPPAPDLARGCGEDQRRGPIPGEQRLQCESFNGGADEAMAIFMALHSPKLELEAVGRTAILPSTAITSPHSSMCSLLLTSTFP
ncbi:unnamed protein product, partial [Urochloa humidicola]